MRFRFYEYFTVSYDAFEYLLICLICGLIKIWRRVEIVFSSSLHRLFMMVEIDDG